MRFLKTCLFLLLLVTAANGYAQGEKDQLYSINRFHLADGQEADFTKAIRAMSDVYFAGGMDHDVQWYRVDDKTYDVVSPINDYADLDRIDAKFSRARAGADSTVRKAAFNEEKWYKMVSSQESMVLIRRASASYRPAGSMHTDLTPCPYAKILTFEVKEGVTWTDLGKHAAGLVSIMQETKSPLDMNFYTMEYGGNSRTFQVEYVGTNAAAVEAALKKGKELGGDALKKWQARAGDLAEQVSKEGLTYVADLSQVGAAPPSNLYAVQIERFDPKRKKDHLAGYKMITDALRKGGADLYWSSSMLDDGTIYSVVPIDHMSDIDGIMDQMKKRSYQVKQEDWAKIGSVMDKSPASYEIVVVKEHPELGFGMDRFDPAVHTAIKQYDMDIKPGKTREAMAVIKEAGELCKKYGGLVPFQVFTYEMGGASDRIVVRDYGKSKEWIDATNTADHKKMGKDYDDWAGRLMEVMTPVSETFGRFSPETAYLPEAK